MTYSGTQLKTRSVCVWSNAFYIVCVRQSKDGPIRRPVGHAIKMAPITIVPSARGDRETLAAVVGQRRGKRGRSPDDWRMCKQTMVETKRCLMRLFFCFVQSGCDTSGSLADVKENCFKNIISPVKDPEKIQLLLLPFGLSVYLSLKAKRTQI